MNPNFIFIFVAVVVALTRAETDSSENNNPKMVQASIVPRDKQSDEESDMAEKISRNNLPRQRRPNSVPSERRQASPPKFHRSRQQDFFDDVAIPHLGFSNNPRQSIYLSDYTGEYDVRLHDFQRRQPTRFQAALGAISAHILNQRNNQEYVPYPPNGDPYDHPSYRGNPAATEPPVVRAYERETKADYGAQPPEDFDQQNPSRLLTLEGHRPANPNHFHHFQEPSFYNFPNFFSHDPLHPGLKAAKPLYEYRWYKDNGQVK